MKSFKENSRKGVFSLADVIAAFTIAAILIIALLMLYSNMEKRAVAINTKLAEYTLPNEILQRIAEDIDRVATPGADVTLTVANKYDSGFRAAKLMSPQRHQIHFDFLDIQIPIISHGRRVGMKINLEPIGSRFVGSSDHFSDFFQGLDGADFVVGKHQGYQRCLRSQGILKITRINATVIVNR